MKSMQRNEGSLDIQFPFLSACCEDGIYPNGSRKTGSLRWGSSELPFVLEVTVPACCPWVLAYVSGGLRLHLHPCF